MPSSTSGLQSTWVPSLIERSLSMWRYGGEDDETGYLHEMMGPEQFEPQRTDYYLQNRECIARPTWQNVIVCECTESWPNRHTQTGHSCDHTASCPCCDFLSLS